MKINEIILEHELQIVKEIKEKIEQLDKRFFRNTSRGSETDRDNQK